MLRKLGIYTHPKYINFKKVCFVATVPFIPCVFYFKRDIRKNEIVIARFSFSIYLYREKRSEKNDKEIEMKYRPEILLESISFLFRLIILTVNYTLFQRFSYIFISYHSC